jgi:hypothetical protein
MNIKIGLTSPVGSPAHNAALAEIARREGEIDAQISAVTGNVPTASPGTPAPAAGPGGLPTTLHYDANGNRIG